MYIAKVFFPDTGAFKRRPVVIVANNKAIDLYAYSVPLTSSVPRDEYDIDIIYWKEAGLAKKSCARTSKPLTIHLASSKKIGEMNIVDLQNIIEMCKQIF